MEFPNDLFYFYSITQYHWCLSFYICNNIRLNVKFVEDIALKCILELFELYDQYQLYAFPTWIASLFYISSLYIIFLMVLVFCLNCLDVFINILKVISRTPYSIMKSIFLNVKNKTKIHFLSLQFSTFLPFCPCKFFFSLCKMRLFYFALLKHFR